MSNNVLIILFIENITFGHTPGHLVAKYRRCVFPVFKEKVEF